MIEKNLKSTLIAVVVGVSLFAALMNMGTVLHFIGSIADLIFPLLMALIVAFVLNVPVKGMEHLFEKAFAKSKRQPSKKALRLLGILTTLLGIVLVMTLLTTLIIPEFVRTVKTIAPMIEARLPEWMDALNKLNLDTSPLMDWLNSFDLRHMINSAIQKAGTMVGSIAGVATRTVAQAVKCVIALILSIYIIMDREILARQTKKILYANLKQSAADKICEIAEMIRWNFTKYLSGQCIEAMILGFMILAAFLVFRLPYATLIAMTTSVCALIPIIGATISCVIAFVLTLLTQPDKAIICLIVYLAVQFVENHFVYPHVVGGSVGLSALWTLIAVLLGGEMFGLVGVIFFIPLTASVYALVREFTNRKLEKKGLSFDPPEEENSAETNDSDPPGSSGAFSFFGKLRKKEDE